MWSLDLWRAQSEAVRTLDLFVGRLNRRGGEASNHGQTTVVPVVVSRSVRSSERQRQPPPPPPLPTIHHPPTKQNASCVVFAPFLLFHSAQVNDGTIEKLFLEDGTGYTDVSSGDTVLAAL